MLTDVEIARNAKKIPITEIAQRIGLTDEETLCYGKYKAKIAETAFGRLENNRDGKLILVTAISPTPAGEGKTTLTVGLGQALAKLGKNSVIALREPSLGPVFGVKGGAAGGGYSQILPMDEINLHFTGDMHAITAANNLLCAALDNHIYHGNALGVDVGTVLIKRAMDMNDRAIRSIVVGLGGKTNGYPREDGFMITVATEVMAILCLAENLSDLKNRLGNILVAYSHDKKPIFARDLKVHGSMTALLKDALLPNIVQTTENTPCIIHGGPFANIAHGCNSVRATKLALKLADYVVTEAGFGADLGAEKFLDIKCRSAGLSPSAIVIVATIKALKYNGGCAKGELKHENLEALAKGKCNLEKHVENMQKYRVPVIVAVNVFESDTPEELGFVQGYCESIGAACELARVFSGGGEGGIALAEKVVLAADSGVAKFKHLYEVDLSIKEKIKIIATEIYGADDVIYTKKADTAIRQIERLGLGAVPVCMAKTQYSLSDDAEKLGRPSGFKITVRDVRMSAGAGFAVALLGDIMTMPGLSKAPALEEIDVDENGNIIGVF